MADYKKLRIWQKAFDISLLIYDAAEQFPTHEKFGLANQMERAAVSISSNIAEGYGRCSDREFYYFLSVARGSLYEVQTQLYIAAARRYMADEQVDRLNYLLDELGRMLSAFMHRMEVKDSTLGKR